jgi:excisionase family DNA binding protein
MIGDMEPLLTMNEVIKILKVARSTVYRFIDQNMLHPVKMGGRIMFKQKDLENFVKSLPHVTKKNP